MKKLIIELCNDIAQLTAENERLSIVVAELTAENEKLKEQLTPEF